MKCIYLCRSSEYSPNLDSYYKVGEIYYYDQMRDYIWVYYMDGEAIYFDGVEFDKYFVTLKELRNQKIDEILK